MANETVTIEVPKPHYTLFNNKRDRMPEVIVINDALLSFAHASIFPWHLRIEIEVLDLAENGMPAHAESQLLFGIGDRIESAVLSGRTQFGGENALFLARSTWNGIRELHFQVHDPEITHAALQQLLTSEEWQRDWEYRMHDDPEWQYAAAIFQLFPLARGRDA